MINSQFSSLHRYYHSLTSYHVVNFFVDILIILIFMMRQFKHIVYRCGCLVYILQIELTPSLVHNPCWRRIAILLPLNSFEKDLMELSDGDLLNKSEEYEHAIDEQIPAIYTSEDERIPTPAVLSDTSRSPVFPDNRQKTVQPLKGDIKYTESNAYSLSIPTKKARLSISSGLVSYAIDDDDDEHNVIDTDQNTDSDDNESSSKSQSGHEFHLGSIDLPLDTLGQPLTIFSSDQPINISSQNQGHILEPSNDIKNPNLLTNEIKPESPILTERLIHVVQLPPEPTGHCSMVLQERVERAVRRMRLDISYDPNRAIQDNKAFRNPRFVNICTNIN
ncbi:SAP30-binding protein isoform 1 [Schistosoma japonicum]|uniref:SAP30-binding protein isoform 1 n=1 Tax=Schistosoma japonicum TaxID=6182 RepID=A0A4Z2D1L9_SCHJA|nr:SAP30-binding protein isoform 1 [Schistosoma japonicum]